MKFLETSNGNFINAACVKKLYALPGYEMVDEDGVDSTRFASVECITTDGEDYELAFFDTNLQGYEDAKAYLKRLIDELEAEQ